MINVLQEVKMKNVEVPSKQNAECRDWQQI